MCQVGGDAAAYFSPGDSTELASMLIDVLGDEHRRSLIIQRGRVRAKQFSWSRTARETADAYRLITGEAPTAVS